MAYRHVITGISSNLTNRHRKSANSNALSVSGGRRKNPYNGDKPWAHAVARATSCTVTIILYLVNFLRSQILSITSYCRYWFHENHTATLHSGSFSTTSYVLTVASKQSSSDDASAILDAKVQNSFEIIRWITEKMCNFCLHSPHKAPIIKTE